MRPGSPVLALALLGRDDAGKGVLDGWLLHPPAIPSHFTSPFCAKAGPGTGTGQAGAPEAWAGPAQYARPRALGRRKGPADGAGGGGKIQTESQCLERFRSACGLRR